MYRKALGCQVKEWKKCEALMSMTRSSDKRPGFHCQLIDCLSFQNTVFDFKKHLKKMRPSLSEIQQPPKLLLEVGVGNEEVAHRQGGCQGEEGEVTARKQNNKILINTETAVN